MNREILFRGKRIDNGEWVEGYYFIDLENKKPYIMLKERRETIEDWMVKSIEVIPETVGQFTGLLDKNGKRIFEGDIFGNNHVPCRHVIFKDGSFCFNVVHSQGADILSQDRVGRLEIIGNIHDNPEILTTK